MPRRAIGAHLAARPFASVGGTRCDHTARCSTCAIRASPLSRATSTSSTPRTGTDAVEFLDARLPHLDLAERRQDRPDVLEERLVGADDEYPAATQPLSVGIEQPRRTVQPDRRLARARRALDAHGRGRIHAHQRVLLGLDRRDDVAHRSDAGTLDLGGKDLRARLWLTGVQQVLVLHRGDRAVVDSRSVGAAARPSARCGTPGRTSSTPAPASR